MVSKETQVLKKAGIIFYRYSDTYKGKKLRRITIKTNSPKAKRLLTPLGFKPARVMRGMSYVKYSFVKYVPKKKKKGKKR